MLNLIRRLFGIQRAGDGAFGPALVITIQGYGRGAASSPARLVARETGGNALLDCRVEVGTGRSLLAPSALAGTVDDFPDGDYLLEAVLSAAADESGAQPVLRLQAHVGEQARPPLHGRATLLIGGGRADPPADGSIRMDDADLARLLALLPEQPNQVLVRLLRPADAEGLETDASDSDAWFGEDRDRNVLDTTGANGDQAAGLALADLGYDVLSEQPAATDASGAGAATEGAAAEASDATPDWTPAGGEYG